MEITIFAKRRTNKEGKTYYTFLSTLTKKTGEKITASVNFREDCPRPKPEQCPMNIRFEKTDANMTMKQVTREDTGELIDVYKLWITAWTPGAEYVDHSLDDFE